VVKHGTELRAFRADTRDAEMPFDTELRLHRPGESRRPTFPHPLGNQTVGEITEVGSAAEDWTVGDTVYGALGIQQSHIADQSTLSSVPAGLAPEALLCWDPLSVALAGVHDSGIVLGDRTLVTGLGAIGLMAAQLAKLQGSTWVASSDPVEKRRALARVHGVDLALDPTTLDIGVEIKQQTERSGVDVSLEASGSYDALHDALRATRYGGTVASIAYYTGSTEGLHLQGEWHRNQLTLLSIRDLNDVLRGHPRWTSARLRAVAVGLLAEGAIDATGVVDPIVPFEASLEAYREIDRHPERSIKLGVRYG
jgi:threonine dehydrogenase-like Zn-dependent dehydrogenase